MNTDELTENDVVNAVGAYLGARGWGVGQTLTTKERGVDLVATRDGVTIHVEAKGATSSKETTRRYGQPFSRNQAFDHVAKAVLVTLSVVARNDATRAAIAVPDNQHHREFLGRVTPILTRLGVTIFFVLSPADVRVEGSELP